MLDMFASENRRRDEIFMGLINRLTPQEFTSNQANSIFSNANAVPFHVAADMSKIIGSFDGDKDTRIIEKWLQAINSSARLNFWLNNYTLQTARAYLRSPPIFWFDAKKDIDSWDSFKIEFRKTYTQVESLSEKWDRMRARKQGKTVSIMSYFYEKVEFCKKLSLTFDEAKEEILNGLLSKEIE
ncbi:hypothetical protein QE152_g134 [Popillia japonica]|uniref:Retrotransposon gag domain-containing protein n=1 Tax=Popillia japonica TaxID=7064 RepID=A0AAW1NKR1_POPJA